MKILMWLLVLAAIGVLGYVLWTWRQRWLEHRRASEERLTSFIAQAKPPAPPVPPQVPPQVPAVPLDSSLPLQKLLLEAGAKAAEAGEPALSIQLYERLLARFPDSAFAAQARSALEAQKQKLAKA